MKKRSFSFEVKIILAALSITLIPLAISYFILLQDQLTDVDKRIRENLRITGFNIRESELVKEKLYNAQNDFALQYYTQGLIQNLEDVDLIVIGDMTGEKYSHLDNDQIGECFRGTDVNEVLRYGKSYYSLMEGSMGKTLRWFEPIMENGEQIGFLMVGKYYKDINQINMQTKKRYIRLFIIICLITFLSARYLAFRIKKAILNMEPEEISKLYIQKNSILNSVQEGIVALDENYEICEVNENAKRLLKGFPKEELMEKIKFILDERKVIRMQEYHIKDKKFFISIQPIMKGQVYLGVVITIMDKEEINRVAKEITGVEEINKNLRAIIHEFKNNLYVILGLLQLQEYDKAQEYIRKIQKDKEEESQQFSEIKDYYVRALLLSRRIIAKEKQVRLIITEDSHFDRIHDHIDSHDLITIIGNLIENAFEACSNCEEEDREVIVSLQETSKYVIIEVSDHGKNIPMEIKDSLFELGTSSKGEGRGTGLYLVKSRVTIYNGEIKLLEEEGEKLFQVIIPKGAV